jgi:Kef-type K+ transport system membrane component KefB
MPRGTLEKRLKTRRAFRFLALVAGVLLLTGAGSEEMLPVLIGLAVILIAAKLGGEVARRFDQPAVLGELSAGMLLGNADLSGITFFETLSANSHLEILAQLGVLLLLFEVGLESTVGQMLQTGVSSLLVALLGVVAPMLLGWGASALLLPNATWHTHVFVGATLTATSVGITARVLRDLNRSQSIESRTILGAAVIDDVLGLVTLSVVLGAVDAANTGANLTFVDGLRVLLQASIFLVGAIVVGIFVVPQIFSYGARLRTTGVLLAMSLSFCMALSWGAGRIGLAPIIGAFAAGLVLEEVHFRDFSGGGRKELEVLIRPLVSFLAPVFFVTMGMKTDFAVFADPRVILMSAVLIVAAVIGKQASSLGVVGRGVDRLTVGIGMIPRGEVGLIFAFQGATHLVDGEPLLSPALLSSLIMVVLVTTMFTPPLLKWSIARAAKREALRLDLPKPK